MGSPTTELVSRWGILPNALASVHLNLVLHLLLCCTGVHQLLHASVYVFLCGCVYDVGCSRAFSVLTLLLVPCLVGCQYSASAQLLNYVSHAADKVIVADHQAPYDTRHAHTHFPGCMHACLQCLERTLDS